MIKEEFVLLKKKLGWFIAPALVVGLAACNTDTDNAFQQPEGNRMNPVTNVDNDLYRVNNRYPFDHQGPLAEDYNRDNRRNGNGTRMSQNNDRTPIGVRNNNERNDRYPFDHQGPLTEDYDNGRNNGGNDRSSLRNRVQDNLNVNTRRSNDINGTISNYRTNTNSSNYPHTRAVLIQEAKYQFIPVDPNSETEAQTRLRRNHEIEPAPEQQQLWKRGQQPQAQAPQQQGQQPQAQAPEQQKQPAQQAQTPANVSQAVQQVIDLTNEQRRQNGLQPLQVDAQLNHVAQKKSEDMRQNGYFSHTSPTYGSPFDMMRDFGVTYQSAAENIAQGQRTPQQVVQAWMNSQGHRENILGNYTHIGVGYDPAGHHWTQMFIRK